MRALRWVDSVKKPACQPVSETTGRPIASSAMDISATDCCSPVESRTSISRLLGRGLSSRAFSMRSSVVSPWAESTTTMSCPSE